jgi:uncharacterized damage-inducible protein DinB
VKDVEHDAEARATLARLGIAALPVTIVGGRAIIGFNIRELAGALGIPPQETQALPPEDLLAKYRHLFAGVRRAVLQIPDDRLDWVSPERARTLRQLTWHTFERPDVCLQASEGGRYTAEMVRRYEWLALAYRTGRAIVEYGDRVLARLARTLTEEPDSLAKEVETYFGPATVGSLLELALAHTAHHLRQLYHYFTLLGITPDRPLTDADFAGIRVPPDLF